MSAAAPPPAPRNCDGCTLCCKLLEITELAKPALRWCPHCEAGRGCRIYGSHPEECREFSCGYLMNPTLGEEWRPSRCRMVVTLQDEGRQIVVAVDPVRRGAWRQPPFYAKLKEWAVLAVPRKGTILVTQGEEWIVIFPDSDKSLGPVPDGHVIATFERPGPRGTMFDAVALAPDDPRLAGAVRMSAAQTRRTAQ